MWGSTLYVGLLLGLLQCNVQEVASDRFFDAFYKTNLDEISDAIIQFDNLLPVWLKGSLIRNGIGRFEMGERHVTTALDAYAKLSKFTFTPSNGTTYANYSTKFVQSRSYTEAVQKNDIQPYLMLSSTSPPLSRADLLAALKNGPDNMNVNVYNYGNGTDNDYVITSDYWRVYQIDPHTLETKERVDPDIEGLSALDKLLSLGSSHPLKEYGTNNYVTFVSVMNPFPGQKAKYIVGRATSATQREKIAEIEVDTISYMHSFAMTKNYMVLFATPLFIDPIAVIKTFCPLDAFKWDGDKNTTLFLVELKTGNVEQIKTENMFFLHQINAFEDIFGNLAIDVAAYTDSDALRIMDMKNLYNSTSRSMFKPPQLKRYTVDMKRKVVNVTKLAAGLPSKYPWSSTLDFPTINEDYRYHVYCYIYGVVYAVNGSDFLDMALVKKDICTGREDRAWYREGSMFNEAWFVGRPGGSSEDDGVLLVDIVDSFSNLSSLVIFDAKTLTITNTAYLPTSNPFGTHGRFFDNVF